MPDFDPNDMDALFREGVERHEFEYNPNSWTLMEEKLDKKDSRKKILFYLLGLVLLVGSIAIYFYTQPIDIADAKTAEIEESIKAVEEIEAETQSTNTLNSNNQKEINKDYISTDSKESSSNIGAQNSFQSENTGNLIGNEIVSIDSQTESLQNEQQTKDNDNIDAPASRGYITNNGSTLTKPQSKNENISIATLKSLDLALFNSGLRDLESPKLSPRETQISPLALASSNRFAFTVFANPEWSSVGLFEEPKAGWSVGAKFGYQFANKFEVSGGVAYSRKIYKGAGKEYTMEGGWFNDIEPMIMDAKCDVIEIPVALSYYVNGFRNSGFFADLGISSYMLHSEWYGFDYNDALVRPPIYEEVNEENENTHLVGVGRFAIGYQKVLSNNTSFQIAPYLQFPLTGIGAGRVNLYSSGVQIAVKFNTQ